MNSKLVIFDFDGVLFDSGAIVAEHLFKLYPKLTSETQKELLAGNFHDELDKFKQQHGYEDLTDEEAQTDRIEYAQKKAVAPMYEGMRELLQDLHKQGITMALNTSSWKMNIESLLSKNGILQLFDFLATADVSKNKTEKFYLIEEKFGIDKADSIFVTDTLGDLLEAKVAGVPTICVTWGGHDRSYFLREQHSNLVAIVDTVAELRARLL